MVSSKVKNLNLLILFTYFCLPIVFSKSKCEVCSSLVQKFYEGLKTTAKSNFGGGNTHWEEKSLGSFAFSEIRLVEIMDNLCSDNDCHSMVEEHEEKVEQWWFKQYAKKKDTSLHTYLCIDRIAACCASGRWGPNCEHCPGLKNDYVCNDNGKCNGNGTREGTGKCECDEGFTGDACDECQEGYFADTSAAEDYLTCTSCHIGCKSSCTDASPLGCDECKEEGWTLVEGQGCVDVNECSPDSDGETGPCIETEYCNNNPGSYKCESCHTSCSGCTAAGSENCLMCAEGFYDQDGTCKACHAGCSKTCTDATPTSCDTCNEGWLLHDDDTGCQDINECDDDVICDGNEYCLNTAGSYKCKECHESCDGCSGIGDKNCKACATGYQSQDDKCSDIDECAAAAAEEEEEEGVCSKDEMCENLPGSHVCNCKQGLTRKDGVCVSKKVDKKKKKEEKVNGAYKGPADCAICTEMAKNINQGIEETAKSNFGGGNTKWEEKKLGSYAHSETR